jgi:hypothetical protein
LMLIDVGTSLDQLTMMSPARIYSHTQLSDFYGIVLPLKRAEGTWFSAMHARYKRVDIASCVRSFNEEHLACKTQ